MLPYAVSCSGTPSYNEALWLATPPPIWSLAAANTFLPVKLPSLPPCGTTIIPNAGVNQKVALFYPPSRRSAARPARASRLAGSS